MSDDRSMALRFPIALVLSVICLAAPAWADYQAGMDAYNSGNYATALRELRPLAEQGDPRAQFRPVRSMRMEARRIDYNAHRPHG